MRLKNRLAGNGIAMVLFLSGGIMANAADIAGEEPPEPAAPPVQLEPVNTWSGPFVGATLGYGFGKTDAAVGEIDTDGMLGGGFVGYNFRYDNFVYGLEGDVGYNAMDGATAGTGSEAGVEGSLRARMGLAVTENILLYGTVGGAAGKLGISDAAGSDSNTMFGWTAGAGVDASLTENVFGRVEYRYTDYGSETFNTGSGAQNVDASSNRIQLGVGMKF